MDEIGQINQQILELTEKRNQLLKQNKVQYKEEISKLEWTKDLSVGLQEDIENYAGPVYILIIYDKNIPILDKCGIDLRGIMLFEKGGRYVRLLRNNGYLLKFSDEELLLEFIENSGFKSIDCSYLRRRKLLIDILAELPNVTWR